uniref:Cysteine-rich motor neuron 1 protein n=1 Tax=Phallusia mammillata TaxID=59560 RepID=A0A6F9DAK4_9ASCI|nr:cysteine-rich motor neuron 1 protein [Phallusia mammillata]
MASLKIGLTLLVAFSMFAVSLALTCNRCNQSACPELKCKGGVILDPCQCCYMCAKQENETCGGMYEVYGQCDMKLSCVIRLNPGGEVTGNEMGTCRPALNSLGDTEMCKQTEYNGCNIEGHDCNCDRQTACSNPYQYQNVHQCNLNLAKIEERNRDCQNRRCGLQPSPTCPDDSVIQEGYIPEGSCCPLPSKCVCDMDSCLAVICHPSTEKVLVRPGNEQPGSCCDLYECRPIADKMDCTSVNCDDNLVSAEVCPDDSDLLPASEERRQCCQQDHVCKCHSVACEVPQCPNGLKLEVLFRGDGNPGACCSVYKCSAEPLIAGCALQGHRFESGESYELPDCRTCECKNGVSLCEPLICPTLSCSRLTKAKNECCAVCADDQTNDVVNGGVNIPYPLCKDGEHHYAVGDTWEPDHCTSCECVEGGKKRCNAAFCQGTLDTKTLPDLCPSLDDCQLTADDCPYGFKRDEQNCKKCACVETQCPSFADCNINCPNGFQKDASNCPICQCKSGICTAMTSCNKQCPYGFRKQKNGCDKCKCRRCPSMTKCGKYCASGLDHDRFGCTICKCRDSQTSDVPRVGGRACQDMEANQRRDDGEVWNSGCYMCMCKGGNIMCDLLKCPVPSCKQPALEKGACCPTCNTDSRSTSDIPPPMTCQVPSGKWYVEGEIWDMDGNSTCTCYGADMLCTSAWCPPTPCDNPIVVEGDRCPICKDNGAMEDNTRTCTVGLKEYGFGETWKVSSCKTCACIGSSEVHCFTKTCPETYNCKQPILRHGDCCLSCLENIDDEPISRANFSCYIDGAEYKHSEQWEDGCQTCTCVQGHASCHTKTCPEIAQNCPRIISADGCCDQCDGGSYLPDKAESSNRQTIAIATGVSFLVVVLASSLAVWWFCCRHRRHTNSKYQSKVISSPEGNSRLGHRLNSTKPLMSTSSDDAGPDAKLTHHV